MMNFKRYEYEFAAQTGSMGTFTFATARVTGRGTTESRERPTRALSVVLPANNQGKPITEEIAVALRQLILGQCPAVVRCEYFTQGPGLVFREQGQPLAYGLTVTNPSTSAMMRSLIMAVQAQILRTLLFDSAGLKLPKTCSPMMPTAMIQQEALAFAISNIIWKAGSGQSAILCLPQPSIVHVVGSPQFNQDGLTEKLHLCHMNRMEDLHQTVRRNIHVFQEDPGPALMLVLYSTILTRGIEQVTEDLGRPTGGDGVLTPVKCMLNMNGSISFSPISLFLSGRASPFLHNGVQYQEDGQGCTIEETGVLIRAPVGLLVWMGCEEKTASYNVGSRFKTPIVPIWIVIAAEQTGVLFGEDKGLLRDHQAENRFQLHYYTSTFHQLTPLILKINNRSTRDDSTVDASIPTLEKLIRTKWGDAGIDWSGVEPFV